MAETLPHAPQPERLPIHRTPLTEKLQKQRLVRDRPVIACTDIDNTWQRRSPNLQAQTQELHTYLTARNIPIVAVTGRDLNMVLTDKDLYTPDGKLHFDAAFTAVGTEFYIKQPQPDGSEKMVMDPDWERKVRDERGFKRDVVYDNCLRVVSAVQTGTPDAHLIFQPRDTPENVSMWNQVDQNKAAATPVEQRPQPYKISFHADFQSETDLQAIVATFQQTFTAAGIGEIKVIPSHDKLLDNGQTRFNIDVVPVSKQEALQFLKTKYQQENPQLVFGGDSGNDADALTTIGGVMVGGSKAELKDAVSSLPTVKRTGRYAHFVPPDEPGVTRIIYTADEASQGPQALLRFAHIQERLERFQKPTSDI